MYAFVKILLFIYSANQCLAAYIPKNNKNDIITKYRFEPWNADKYSFEYDTSSGSSRNEVGYYKPTDKGEKILTVKGFYTFIGDDSKKYRVDYYADETGYHPTISIMQDDSKKYDIDELLDSLEATDKTPILKSLDPIELGNRILPPGVIASLLG